MKHLKIATFFGAIVLISIGLSSCDYSDNSGFPFQNSEVSEPEYDGMVTTSQFVPMSDGVNLAADVYTPADGPTTGPFPAILCYVPYKRSTVDADGNLITAYGPDHVRMIREYTSRGYVLIIADMRGSGASTGHREVDMSPQLATDGKELVEWIASQSWCDGNVGMYGGSYFGWSQYATAGQMPAALKCIMPDIIFFDAYDGGIFYSGGIYNKGLNDFWGNLMTILDLDLQAPGLLPSFPIMDEDGDGQVRDEIPVDQNGDGFYFDDFPPVYPDGVERTEHHRYNAVLGRLQQVYPHQWAPDAPYRDSFVSGTGYTYTDLGPGDWIENMVDSGVAVYVVNGWFDVFAQGAVRWFATLRGTNPAKMVLHPSFHSIPSIGARNVGAYWDSFGDDFMEFGDAFTYERIRFLDRYLKGIQNGIDTEPPVHIYVMNGEGWRAENEWPLARQEIANAYFGPANELLPARTGDGADDYTADLTHDSSYGSNNGNRWSLTAPDAVMIRTDKDKQCLTYTSASLPDDMEVTGHPTVRFWVSSTAAYGDFFVYLEDVEGTGEDEKAYLVTEGMLRAGFAGLVSEEEDILPPGSDIDIKPDLNHHGFRQNDYQDGILAGGAVVEIVIDLKPTSWVFKEGHRVRVAIACADSPTFPLHPRLSPSDDPADPNNIVPTITVYRDTNRPSRIELPLIPPKGKPWGVGDNPWEKMAK